MKNFDFQSSDEYDMLEGKQIHPMTMVRKMSKSSDEYDAFRDLPSFENLVSLSIYSHRMNMICLKENRFIR
jgi:hypothetical protein